MTPKRPRHGTEQVSGSNSPEKDNEEPSSQLLADISEHDETLMTNMSIHSRPVPDMRKLPTELSWPDRATEKRAFDSVTDTEGRRKKIAEAVKTIIGCLGEDVEREGLLKTPDRFASAILFLTQGYTKSLDCKISFSIY